MDSTYGEFSKTGISATVKPVTFPKIFSPLSSLLTPSTTSLKGTQHGNIRGTAYYNKILTLTIERESGKGMRRHCP